MKQKKCIAIIPARGGSKGVPRKNVLPIAGKPLIAWSIETALASKYIDTVFVSTDDAEIANVVKHYRAEVIWRPAKLASDSASSESALLHALGELATQGIEPELLVFIQCTAPLTLPNDIDTAIEKFKKEQADSCFTATNFHFFIWHENLDGSMTGINHDKSFRPRRQDRQPQLIENGAIYIMNVAGFKKAEHRFFGKTIFSLMPQERSFEIDEPVDFEIAEILLKRQQRNIDKLFLPKAILFDFDGVFTNNKVYVSELGIETVRCDRSDGMGISQLKKLGVRLVVLSTEKNPVVSARCNKLGIDCLQNLGDKKIDAFLKWCKDANLTPEEVLFIGNDVNDVECLKCAGFGVVPSDAHPSALNVADMVLKLAGGKGVVRELCDWLLNNFKENRGI